MDPLDTALSGLGCAYLLKYARVIIGIVIIIVVLVVLINFIGGFINSHHTATPIPACTSDPYCPTGIDPTQGQLGGDANIQGKVVDLGANGGTLQFVVSGVQAGQFTLKIDLDLVGNSVCKFTLSINNQAVKDYDSSSGQDSSFTVSLTTGNNTIELATNGGDGCGIIDLQLNRQR